MVLYGSRSTTSQPQTWFQMTQIAICPTRRQNLSTKMALSESTPQANLGFIPWAWYYSIMHATTNLHDMHQVQHTFSARFSATKFGLKNMAHCTSATERPWKPLPPCLNPQPPLYSNLSILYSSILLCVFPCDNSLSRIDPQHRN